MIDQTIAERTADESPNERAVSPVIGVILMVAITVILAAVIAAFVLDLGPGDPDPTASVSISGDGTSEVEVTLNSMDSNTEGVAITNSSGDVYEVLTVSGASEIVNNSSIGENEGTVYAFGADPTDVQDSDNIEEDFDSLAILEEFELDP